VTALAAPAPEVPQLLSRPTVPWPVAVPLVVIAGVLLDAAFPSVGAWALAFPAVAAALLVARGRSLRASTGYGVLFGVAFMVPQLQWSGIFVGALPWLSLAALEGFLLGLVLPGFTLAWRLADHAAGRWLGTLPLTSGAVWVASEALRSRWPFDGFGWGRLAFSQADSPLVFLASLGGVPLVAFGVVAVSASVVCVAVAVQRAARSRHSAAGGTTGRVVAGLLGPVVVLALVAAGAGYGGWRTERTLVPGTDGTVTVAAVQGDVPRAGLDFNAQRRAVLDNHVEETLALAARVDTGEVPAPDLVLWPENASDIDPLANPDAAAQIARATDAVGAPLLLGAVLQGPGENITNAMLLWEPGTGYRGRDDDDATANGYYAKQAIAPFAEYIPYRDFFRMFSPLVDRVTDFAPGDRAAVLQMGGALVGPVICFEVVDDDTVRRQVLAGADLLVVPTNNATFGASDENVQQLAMSRLRAVEHGRSVVHISNVGTSAVIAPDGTTGPRTGLFEPAVLVDQVELRSGSTLATLVGPAPERALLAVALLLVLGNGIASQRREAAARVRQDQPR